jgi:hypothetical protein
MEIGSDVEETLKQKLYDQFTSYVGDDSVFLTKNGPLKILTKFVDHPYSYVLLKPYASTIPLAADDITKLFNCKYFLQLDGMNAYWSIPVCEESKRLTAFHPYYRWGVLLESTLNGSEAKLCRTAIALS